MKERLGTSIRFVGSRTDPRAVQWLPKGVFVCGSVVTEDFRILVDMRFESALLSQRRFRVIFPALLQAPSTSPLPHSLASEILYWFFPRISLSSRNLMSHSRDHFGSWFSLFGWTCFPTK